MKEVEVLEKCDYPYISVFFEALEDDKHLYIVHRDSKMENIILDENMKAKIIDFGLCGRNCAEDKIMASCGSPAYLAPEIINKNRYSKEVDIWSLGVTLYAMTHGVLPLYDKNIIIMLMKITAGKPEIKMKSIQ